MTTFLLVRHGQTELNLAERFRGRSEAPLNETGLAQAEAVARRIASGWKPASIYPRPLSRAIQTGQPIARACGIPLQPEPGLIDIDFGDWQGLSFSEARQRWPQEIENWRQRPHQCQLPNGEILGDVRRRAMKTLHQLGLRHPDVTIVLIGHTVTNQLLLLGILDLGIDHFWRIRQGNCALNVIESREGVYILVSMNETAHLAGLPVENLRELHITGIGPHEGCLVDHMEMQAADWVLLDWALEQIRAGLWAVPGVAALEYGGIGEPFRWRSQKSVLAEQVPQLYRRLRGKAAGN